MPPAKVSQPPNKTPRAKRPSTPKRVPAELTGLVTVYNSSSGDIKVKVGNNEFSGNLRTIRVESEDLDPLAEQQTVQVAVTDNTITHLRK
jgi:hypothetical protein